MRQPSRPPPEPSCAGTPHASTRRSRTMPLPPFCPRAKALLPACLSLVVLAACQDEQARSAPPAASPSHPGRPSAPAERSPVHEATADLVSVSEAEGRVLVELPIGSAQGVAVGAFFRVYDAADARR